VNVDAALLLEDCRCPSCSRVLKAGAGVFAIAVAGDVVEVCYYCLVEALRTEADARVTYEVQPEQLELETAQTSPAAEPEEDDWAEWDSFVDRLIADRRAAGDRWADDGGAR